MHSIICVCCYTHFSYQPTLARDLCNFIGNSPKASTVWFKARRASLICSSVRSEGYRDRIIFASLLKYFCQKKNISLLHKTSVMLVFLFHFYRSWCWKLKFPQVQKFVCFLYCIGNSLLPDRSIITLYVLYSAGLLL